MYEPTDMLNNLSTKSFRLKCLKEILKNKMIFP